MENARHEVQEIKKYDYLVVNRDIREALESLKSIVMAERLKLSRVINGEFRRYRVRSD